MFIFFFFFSSRRRHTRSLRDWSSDVCSSDLGLRGRIDVLLANVPYVATRHIPLLPAEARDHEPHAALDGGGDGLDVFRAVISGAGEWLAPGGIVLSEITEAQAETAL